MKRLVPASLIFSAASVGLLACGDTSSPGDTQALQEALTDAPARFTSQGSLSVSERTRYRKIPGRLGPQAAPMSSSDAPQHHLKIECLDRDGQAGAAQVTITDLLSGQAVFDDGAETGSFELDLPEGQYGIGAAIMTPIPGDGHRASETIAYVQRLDLVHESDLLMDARRGKPVSVSVDEPSAQQVMGVATVGVPTARGPVQFPVFPITFNAKNPLYAVPTDEEEGFSLDVKTTWAPDRNCDDPQSPYTYHLVSVTKGRIPEDPTYRVRKDELVAVRAHWSAQGISSKDGFVVSSPVEDFANYHVSLDYLCRLGVPGARVDYITPGEWYFETYPSSSPQDVSLVRTQYPRPGVQRQQWGRMPLGPAFPTEVLAPYPTTIRDGDSLRVLIPTYSEPEAGHYGDFRNSVTGWSRLRRGEEVLREVPYVGELGEGLDVPPEPSQYEMTMYGAREVPWSIYAIEQTITWNFSSRHTNAPEPLPLLALRYSPELDAYGRAQAGALSTFEVRVEHNDRKGPPVRKVDVSVSYDDGKNWEQALTVGVGDKRRVIVQYPADAEFVSLRGTAVDEKGNSVTQTMIRAYGLRH